MNPSSLPLAGVNVVDFGQYIAGPAVAMILADLGATVIHVDPPGGSLWDSPANAILNRNKLSVEIDLKSEQGLADAHALIAQADILIEGFRNGVMARLGIDFKRLREERPELITLSIPGFASNDALRAEWRAFESVVAAQSGVFTDMGLNRVLMGINPSFSPLPLSSAYGTMLAASSVVIALQAREEVGFGDHIEVPLATAVMEGLCYNSIEIENLPERYLTQREREIARRREAGLPMDLSFDDLQELLDPFYRSYRCKDGRYFYVVCPSHRFHAKRCLQTLGIYDELVEQGLVEQLDTYKPQSQWTSDVSLGVYPLPKKWADKIAERMKEIFLTRSASEWEKIFGWGKFPGARQRWLQEWIYDDHVEMSGLMLQVDDPIYGRMLQPGPLVWLRESAHEMETPSGRTWGSVDLALSRLSANPRPEFSFTDPDQSWMAGVKILDLCNVIAGPHSVGYFARFGADIIKIDPATPLYDAWNTVIFGMSHMRSKRSALLDIREGAGREALERLIKQVDVVVWNATDAQVAAMKLDREHLQQINPDVILCQLDCFSGIRPGPKTNYLGYDDLVQACTGIMQRFGGSMDRVEEHAHVGTIDVMCGFGGAVGVAAALYQRRRTGRVGQPKTSLSALSGLAQIPFCFDYRGRGPFNEPSGPYVRGYHALERLYEAADGWMMIACSEKDLASLEAVVGKLPEGESEREEYLAQMISSRTRDEWVEQFQLYNLGAAPCGKMEVLRTEYSRPYDDSCGVDRGSYAFSIYADHPAGRKVVQLDACAVRPSRAPLIAPRPSEKYGASTRNILSELGYSAEEIDAMIEQGTASDSWSGEYFPS
ncbi:MAG TPA: CoA transferase [Marinobacterium sp.]|nr:CoA transferase [Marinobacterium sp.]